MKKTFNKQFEYRTYKFNIEVTLEFTIFHTEKHPIKGEAQHQVKVNCMGMDNYYEKVLCGDSQLEATITEQTLLAKSYVDRKLTADRHQLEQTLLDQGFI